MTGASHIGNSAIEGRGLLIEAAIPEEQVGATATGHLRNAVPTSLNWHVWPLCNYSCKFCFATFKATPRALSRDDALQILPLLASAGTQKLTFAGGEPLLCPYLDALLIEAKAVGLTTMIVTNGSLVTETFLDRVAEHIDWIALSVDSVSEETEQALGRGNGLHVARARGAACRIRARGIGLKVNTVVTALNWREDMAGLIREMAPNRWKVFQALTIAGENEGNMENLRITDEQFRFFLQTHKDLSPVAEDNDAMTGSYLMMDPLGRLFQNSRGVYTYSDPVQRVGLHTALDQVGWDWRKFLRRGGEYNWARKPRIGVV